MQDTVQVGRDAREDLVVELTSSSGSTTEIQLHSTVATFFGARIQQVVRQTLEQLGLEGVQVVVRDQGALDWVIQARVEAAAHLLRPQQTAQRAVLPPMLEGADRPVARDRMRRSRLYLPGDQPDLMINAALFEPDAVILDLEDAVAPPQKFAARYLVRNALRAVDFGPAERMVRINQLPRGLADLPDLVSQPLHTILLPKAERGGDVAAVAQRIRELVTNSPREIFIMPILESALGIENALAIASAEPEVVALAFGAEDFTRDIGAVRTDEGRESFVARSRLVLAARAAGVQPIDTVYSDVGNEAGLLAATREAIALGFDGKGCIHPRQIRTIHQAFRPSERDVAYALKVQRAMAQAEVRGDGVIAIGSKMIDPPVVARAQRVLKLAEFYHMDLSPEVGR